MYLHGPGRCGHDSHLGYMIYHRSGLRLNGLRNWNLGLLCRQSCYAQNRVGAGRHSVHQIFRANGAEGNAPWGPWFLGLRPDQHPGTITVFNFISF